MFDQLTEEQRFKINQATGEWLGKVGAVMMEAYPGNIAEDPHTKAERWFLFLQWLIMDEAPSK